MPNAPSNSSVITLPLLLHSRIPLEYSFPTVSASHWGIQRPLVCVRPHAPARLEEPFEAKHWRVDGALPRVQEHVVQEAAKEAAKEWGNHRDLQQELVRINGEGGVGKKPKR